MDNIDVQICKMIKKIRWAKDKILGNLELDFTRDDGRIYPTIVIAGENGTGKTRILTTLAEFLNRGSMFPFRFIEYHVAKQDFKIYYDNENDGKYGFHLRHNAKDLPDHTTRIRNNKNNNNSTIDQDIYDIRRYGVLYSSARSGFKASKIVSTTNTQLDNKINELDLSDDFTDIKQLFVDIETQDNADWREKCENHSELSIENFDKTSRMSRFKNAFNDFFGNLSFDRIDNTNPDKKIVLFKKKNQHIAIDDLSTGEKQIVFRGAQMLRNQNAIAGREKLIDEPELSLHPRWQKKILRFYRNLFDIQQDQMIVATHSEQVLKSAIEDDKTLVYVLRYDENGDLMADKIDSPDVLPSVTLAEVDYLAYKIASTDYHIELYGYLQRLTKCKTIRKCDSYILSKIGNRADMSVFERHDQYIDENGNMKTYDTLPTYIRNAIDHPDGNRSYTDDDLNKSILLLRELCSDIKAQNN